MPAGLAETLATAIASSSRPIARQASPQSDFDTPSSPRSQSAASTISGQPAVRAILHRQHDRLEALGLLRQLIEIGIIREATGPRIQAGLPCLNCGQLIAGC